MDERRPSDSRPRTDADRPPSERSREPEHSRESERLRESGRAAESERGPAHEGRADPEHGAGRPNSVSPPWVKRILLLFLGISVAAAAGSFVFDVHGEHPLEKFPLFYPLYGFLGISGLILASKALRRLVMRREDYYDAE